VHHDELGSLLGAALLRQKLSLSLCSFMVPTRVQLVYDAGGAAAAANCSLVQPIPLSPPTRQPASKGTAADTASQDAKAAAQQALLEAVTAPLFSRRVFSERSAPCDLPTSLP